jgi:hypothetical protein
VPIGVQTCEISTRQGHDKKKSIGELGKKNQADAGRVSYTSPLQRNVLQLSQEKEAHARLRYKRVKISKVPRWTKNLMPEEVVVGQ